MTDAETAREMGISLRTLYRRRLKGDLSPGRHTPRPAPTLLGPVAAYLEAALGTDSRAEWARRLGVNRATVTRWLHLPEVPRRVRALVEYCLKPAL